MLNFAQLSPSLFSSLILSISPVDAYMRLDHIDQALHIISGAPITQTNDLAPTFCHVKSEKWISGLEISKCFIELAK